MIPRKYSFIFPLPKWRFKGEKLQLMAILISLKKCNHFTLGSELARQIEDLCQLKNKYS